MVESIARALPLGGIRIVKCLHKTFRNTKDKIKDHIEAVKENVIFPSEKNKVIPNNDKLSTYTLAFLLKIP
jgi:hypothetical protein